MFWIWIWIWIVYFNLDLDSSLDLDLDTHWIWIAVWIWIWIVLFGFGERFGWVQNSARTRSVTDVSLNWFEFTDLVFWNLFICFCLNSLSLLPLLDETSSLSRSLNETHRSPPNHVIFSETV